MPNNVLIALKTWVALFFIHESIITKEQLETRNNAAKVLLDHLDKEQINVKA